MFVQTFRRVSYVTRAVYRIFFSSCADPDWDRTAHISRHTRPRSASGEVHTTGVRVDMGADLRVARCVHWYSGVAAFAWPSFHPLVL